MRYSLCILCVAFLSLSLVAAEGHAGARRDGYAFRGGKVVMMKDGHETAVTGEVRLNNGFRLLPDGFIVDREGRRERFRDNQLLTVEGDWVAYDAAPGVDTGAAVVVDDDDGYFFDNGQLYVYQNNIPVLVSVEVTLGDGRRLMPDGTIIGVDGVRTRLNAGQQISKSGKIGERKANAQRPANTGTNANGANNTNPKTPIDASHRVEQPNQPVQPQQQQQTQPQREPQREPQQREPQREPAREPAREPQPSQPSTQEKHDSK